MITLLNYTRLSTKQHEELLAIRNLPAIREYAGSFDPIKMNEHLQWIETLKTSSKKLYLAILFESSPIGGLHFIKNELNNNTWGIFFRPDTSTTIISSVTLNFIDISFDRFKTNTLISIVHKNNKSAIRFNERLGFKFSQDNDINPYFVEMKLQYKQWKNQKEGKILKKIQKLISTIPVEMES